LHRRYRTADVNTPLNDCADGTLASVKSFRFAARTVGAHALEWRWHGVSRRRYA